NPPKFLSDRQTLRQTSAEACACQHRWRTLAGVGGLQRASAFFLLCPSASQVLSGSPTCGGAPFRASHLCPPETTGDCQQKCQHLMPVLFVGPAGGSGPIALVYNSSENGARDVSAQSRAVASRQRPEPLE